MDATIKAILPTQSVIRIGPNTIHTKGQTHTAYIAGGKIVYSGPSLPDAIRAVEPFTH